MQTTPRNPVIHGHTRPSIRHQRLIDFVKVSHPRPRVGDPVAIAPVLRPQCRGDTMTEVSINGTPGAKQVIQFGAAGRKTLTVDVASARDGQTVEVDQRQVEIEVEDLPKLATIADFRPLLHARQVPVPELTAEFSLANLDDLPTSQALAPRPLRYQWQVDGRTITTREPRLRHDFGADLARNAATTTFDISVRVVAADGQSSAVGRRTVSGWNQVYRDALRRGSLELEVVGEPELVPDGEAWVVEFQLRNPLRAQVLIEQLQIEFLTVADEAPTPLRPAEASDFSLAPDGDAVQRVRIPRAEAPPDMFGVGLHFFGHADPVGDDGGREHTVATTGIGGVGTVTGVGAGRMQAFANVYAEVVYDHPLAQPVLDPGLAEVIDTIDAQRPGGLNERGIAIDEALGEGWLPEGLCPGREPIARGGRMRLLRGPGAPDQRESRERTWRPLSGEAAAPPEPAPEEVAEGERCYAYQTPPEGFACQATDEYEHIHLPGRLLNARKGDVILSPGGGSVIADLMKQVTPQEVYSHSGIMTADHVQLRHSTMSTAWLTNQLAGEFLGQQGSEGFKPDAVTYGWPGTVTQRIDAAFHGEDMDAPDGKRYSISGFSNEITSNDTIGVVWPEVVKPDPRKEYEIQRVRETLHQVADRAEEIDGHYRFYAYTDAAIFFKSDYFPHGRDYLDQPAVDEWWERTQPTVCSSLIWAAAKSIDQEVWLEVDSPPLTSRDIERDDRGAVVQSQTRDGLYFYSEQERTKAAKWLHGYLLDRARDRGGWVEKFGGRLTAAPADIANQITNTFAFDWAEQMPGEDDPKDSDKWKNPGSGNAVSPDTIRDYWDAPEPGEGPVRGLYGHKERLVYRPGRVAKRRVHRWVKVAPEPATLTVQVLFDGQPMPHATVEVGGQSGIADGDGRFQTSLPPGSYTVRAQKSVDQWHLSHQHGVSLQPGGSQHLSITLQRPPEMYRLIEISGRMKLLDDDWGQNEVDSTQLGPTLVQIGPEVTHKKVTWSHSVGGEVRGDMWIKLDWQRDGSVSAEFWAGLYEGKSPDTDDLEAQTAKTRTTVAKGQAISFSNELKGSEGWDDPHAWIDGTLRNGRSPT